MNVLLSLELVLDIIQKLSETNSITQNQDVLDQIKKRITQGLITVDYKPEPKMFSGKFDMEKYEWIAYDSRKLFEFLSLGIEDKIINVVVKLP